MQARLLMCTLVTIGCGGVAGSPPDAGPDVDAGCPDSPVLELGRCVSGAGAPCTGSETDPRFDPMPPDATMTPVIGPQGSLMVALAARTSAIDPGDPTQPAARGNPVLDVTLLDEGGAAIARLFVRSGLVPSEGLVDTYESPQLFVVLEASEGLADRRLTARGVLRDAEGRVRCGSVELRTPP